MHATSEVTSNIHAATTAMGRIGPRASLEQTGTIMVPAKRLQIADPQRDGTPIIGPAAPSDVSGEPDVS